jgi:hypothetical protein
MIAGVPDSGEASHEGEVAVGNYGVAAHGELLTE